MSVDEITDYMRDFHNTTTGTIFMLVFGAMLYTSVGKLSLTYFAGADIIEQYDTCVDVIAEMPIEERTTFTCYKRGGKERDKAIVYAVFWPVTIPFIFTVRHPIGIILLVTSIVGLYGTSLGVLHILEMEWDKMLRNAIQNKRKLKEAEASLAANDPYWSDRG